MLFIEITGQLLCKSSVDASVTSVDNVGESTAMLGAEVGGVIFGGVTSVIFMCANGCFSRKALNKYKALGDLIDKVGL